jgi:hypothetical protein
MSGSAFSLDIATTATATFAALAIFAAKADEDEVVPVEDVDTQCAAVWGDSVDDWWIQVNEVFQGERAITALSVGTLSLTGASPELEVGDNTSNSAVILNKDDTLAAALRFQNESQTRAVFVLDANEAFELQSISQANALQSTPISISSAGASTFGDTLTATTVRGSTLTFTGAATFSSTLAVTGTSTLASVIASGSLNVGVGTTSRNITLNGASTGDQALVFQWAGVSRAQIRHFTSAAFGMRIYDATGVFIADCLSFNGTTGAATLLATTVSSLTSSGAISGTTGTFSGNTTVGDGSTARSVRINNPGAGTETFIEFQQAGSAIWRWNITAADTVQMTNVATSQAAFSMQASNNTFWGVATATTNLLGSTINIGASGGTLGFFGVTAAARASAYTTSNVTTDRSFDADTVAVAELADIVGTLIADLKTYGLLQ